VTGPDAYALYQEGRARLRKGMAAQATVPLERARRLEPGKASIREALGIAYFRLRRWDDAEAEFRAVLEISPVDGWAHEQLGRCLVRQGRADEARRHLRLGDIFQPSRERA
jgi:Flp pilus assembly protein TadD